MSFRRATTLRKKHLQDPELSCGRTIPTSRLGRKRAWWACGKAMDTFENDVEPELEPLLRNAGLGYADIYVRLYMIGSKPESARPTIMICCTNSKVRGDAERAVRYSDLLERFPEFGLGASALPLEQSVRARALAGEVGAQEVGLDTLRKRYAVGDILAESQVPTIGRRVFAVSKDGVPSRCATGGAVVQIGDEYFQITVGHIDEEVETWPTEIASQEDLDECHFDGQSDDEGSEMEDFEALSRASLSPHTIGSSSTYCTDEESEASQIFTPTRSSSPGSARRSPVYPDKVREHHPLPAPLPPHGREPRSLTNIGTLSHHSRCSGESSLDYALIPVAPLTSTEDVNKVHMHHGLHGNVQIRDISHIRSEERKVIIATASGGTLHGVLMPGATFFRAANCTSMQRLYALQVDGIVVEGDCGAAVVDEATGDLYGHIVRGCSGTQTAYIVPATEVFANLCARTGHNVLIASLKNRQRHGVRFGLPDVHMVAATPLFDEPAPPPSPQASDSGVADVTLYPVSPLKIAPMYPEPPSDKGYGSAGFLYQESTEKRLTAGHGGPSVSSSAVGSPRLNHGQLAFVPEYQNVSFGMSDQLDPADYWGGTEYTVYSSSFMSNESKHGFLDPSLIHPEMRPMEPPMPSYSESPSVPSLCGSSTMSTATFGSASPYVAGYHYSPYPAPSSHSVMPLDSYQPSGSQVYPYSGDEPREKQRCPHPDCGKVFKDLKAHMLTHQTERPEKCPIQTCEYHIKGFARKYDKNRHTLTHYRGTMVCGFCPGSGSAAEKSFNRADVFKRHLTAVHGVEQTPPNSRRKGGGSATRTSSPGGRRLTEYAPDATGKCSTCSATFSNAQDFYGHLDDCVLRVVQQRNPSQRNDNHLHHTTTDTMKDSAYVSGLGFSDGNPSRPQHMTTAGDGDDSDLAQTTEFKDGKAHWVPDTGTIHVGQNEDMEMEDIKHEEEEEMEAEEETDLGPAKGIRMAGAVRRRPQRNPPGGVQKSGRQPTRHSSLHDHSYQ